MDEMLQKKDILITGQMDQVVQKGENILLRWDKLQKTNKEVPIQNQLQKDGKTLEKTQNPEECKRDFPMDEMLQKEDILIMGQRDQVVQKGENILLRWDKLQKTNKEVPIQNQLQKDGKTLEKTRNPKECKRELPHGQDAAEGGESSGGSSTQNSPRKSKSRNVKKRKRTKKRKDRNRGEAYKPEHHEEREKE